MWGQVKNSLAIEPLSRIIPMRVGTSKRIGTLTVRFWDHPHACGDKRPSGQRRKDKKGSSPCVWGQELKKLNSIHTSRIIPMRVGTSWSKMPKSIDLRDHPHACGDKASNPLVLSMTSGSSPCVWGQEHSILTYSAHHRIIPMRVGTSYV